MGFPGVKTPYLGGGFFQRFVGEFSPRYPWGFMMQFDGLHIFQMGGEKPPTR